MHPSSAAVAAPPEKPLQPPSLGERWGVGLVLAAFVVVGLRHIHDKAVYGQDFLLHSSATENLMADPSLWFPQDFTNRPLVYWIGIGCHWLTNSKAPYELAGLVFVAMATAALGFFHAVTRRCIGSSWLRVAAVAFVAFLPATQVATVVYAADAVCLLPFALAIWSLLRSVEAARWPGRIGHSLLAAVALTTGCFGRYTGNALIPAAAVALLLLWRARQIPLRSALAIGALALIGPILAATGLAVKAHRQFAGQPPHHLFDWHGTGEMTWSSLLLVKRADARILDAPGYWDHEMVDGADRLVLLVNNRYSYPALLHLTVFTDVLDYANQGENDDGTPRPEPQKSLSKASVWLGLPFSLATVLAMAAFGIRCGWTLVRARRLPSAAVVFAGLFALAWYLPIAASLPFVHNAYEWGYWLSRLIVPALWGFALVLFATASEVLAERRWGARLLALLVLGQAGLHAASLWY